RDTVDMYRLGGMLKDYPMFSFIAAIVLFSLVGIPPLSGFWSKIYLFQESFVQENYFLLACLVFASFVTLFVIARIWSEVFCKDSPKPLTEEIDQFKNFSKRGKFALIFPILFLAGVTLYIGLGASSVFELVGQAANELKNPSIYI